jgi:hypothetical protein
MATGVFDSVESAHEYVGLLLETIEETAGDVGNDLGVPAAGSEQRRAAFRLVAYKLGQLRFHVAVTRQRLDELRTLGRMLEDGTAAMPQEG